MIDPIEQKKLLLKYIFSRGDYFVAMIFLAQLLEFWIVERIPFEALGKFILYYRQRVELAQQRLFFADCKLIALFESRGQTPLPGHQQKRHTRKSSSHEINYRRNAQSVSRLIPAIPAS